MGARALMVILAGVELSVTTGAEVFTAGAEFSVVTEDELSVVTGGNFTAFAILLLKLAGGTLVKSKVMATLREV